MFLFLDFVCFPLLFYCGEGERIIYRAQFLLPVYNFIDVLGDNAFGLQSWEFFSVLLLHYFYTHLMLLIPFVEGSNPLRNMTAVVKGIRVFVL